MNEDARWPFNLKEYCNNQCWDGHAALVPATHDWVACKAWWAGDEVLHKDASYIEVYDYDMLDYNSDEDEPINRYPSGVWYQCKRCHTTKPYGGEEE